MKRAHSLDCRLIKANGGGITSVAPFLKSKSWNSKEINEKGLDNEELNNLVIEACNKLNLEEEKENHNFNAGMSSSPIEYSKQRHSFEPITEESPEIEVPLSIASQSLGADHQLMNISISILSLTGLKATSSITKKQKILKNLSTKSTTSDSNKSSAEIVSAFVSFSRKSDQNESSIVTYMPSTEIPVLNIFDTHIAKWPTVDDGKSPSVINCSVLMKIENDKKLTGAKSGSSEPIELRVGIIHGKEKICLGCTKVNIKDIIKNTHISLPIKKLHPKVWGKAYFKKKLFGESNSFTLEDDAKLDILVNVESKKPCNEEDYLGVTNDLYFLEVRADHAETTREWPDEIYKGGSKEEISTLSTEGHPQYLVEITTDIIRSDKIPDEVSAFSDKDSDRYLVGSSDGSMYRSFSTQLTSTFEEKINETSDQDTQYSTLNDRMTNYPVEVMTDYIEPTRLSEENDVSWILQRQEPSFDENLMLKELQIKKEAYSRNYESATGEQSDYDGFFPCTRNKGICKYYSSDTDYDSSTYDSSLRSGDRTHYSGPLDFLCMKSNKTNDSFMTGDSTSVSWSTSAYDISSGSSGLGTRTFTNDFDEDSDSVIRRFESKYTCDDSSNSSYSILLDDDASGKNKSYDDTTEIVDSDIDVIGNPISNARRKFSIALCNWKHH